MLPNKRLPLKTHVIQCWLRAFGSVSFPLCLLQCAPRSERPRAASQLTFRRWNPEWSNAFCWQVGLAAGYPSRSVTPRRPQPSGPFSFSQETGTAARLGNRPRPPSNRVRERLDGTHNGPPLSSIPDDAGFSTATHFWTPRPTKWLTCTEDGSLMGTPEATFRASGAGQ